MQQAEAEKIIMIIERIAQKAYESYCAYTEWKSVVTGDDLPQWEELPNKVKFAWLAAMTGAIESMVRIASEDELLDTEEE